MSDAKLRKSPLLITDNYDHAQKTFAQAIHQAFSYLYIVWFQQHSLRKFRTYL